MNTLLRSKLRAGGSRQHCQQFDYSTSESDSEPSGAMLPIPIHSPEPENPLLPPDTFKDPSLTDPQSDVSLLDCLQQLFSDHELARSPSPQLSASDSPLEQSLMGTSAPLLTHPSLTDYLSNYPNWPNQAEDSNMSLARPSSPWIDEAAAALPKPPTAPSVKRGIWRPRKKTRIPRQCKVQDKTVPTAPKPTAPKAEIQTESHNRYLLRRKRQPKYKCGTCVLRDCVCV